MIAMFDSMPPMGWSFFSPLNQTFPRGSTIYGGTGGSGTHLHTYSGNTLTTLDITSQEFGFDYFLPESPHTHTITFTTDIVSNLPPYFDMIFAKRNSVNVSITVGPESENGITKAGAYKLGANLTTAFASINNQTISTAIAGGWNYIVQTYNGTTQCLYINGYLEAEQPLTGLINTNANDLMMGDSYNGTIDEVSIWDRALNATEIFENYSGFPTLPIRINSNADFDKDHGVVNWATGNGTASNPWIIENYTINGTGFGYCIYIGNTTDHFIVKNCTLHHASGNSARYFWDSGLVLHNVQNGVVEVNNMSNNAQNGIYFGIGSSNNTIAGNNITSNGNNGVYFAPSGVIGVTENTIFNYNPQINNNGKVVWYGWDGTDEEIFFWDGVTTTQITNNTNNDRNPQINDNGEVVWHGVDPVDLDYEIYLWDGVTTTQITNNTNSDSYAQINNNGEATMPTLIWMLRLITMARWSGWARMPMTGRFSIGTGSPQHR
jgi:parallel beta-helix repeat protein